MANSSGAGDLANTLLPSLVGGKDFSLPAIDYNDKDFQIPELDPNNPIFSEIKGLSNDDLTTKVVGGNGTFDVIMTSVRAHITDEYEKGRITGNDYVKAYIELTAAAMSGAVSYLLQKDQSFWQAALIQQQAQRAMIETVQAKIGLKTAIAQLALARTQAMTAEVEYALTKLKLSTEDAQYAAVLAQTAQTKYQTEQILPIQKVLVQEQMETARAGTLNNRSDGQVVVGSIGKQKDLYSQQITSYQRDSEVKAGKVFTDAWITMKTIDEAITPPNGFTNASIDTVLSKLKLNNGLT